MPRPPGVQLRRRTRTDGTLTYTLRVRVGGADHAILLGNTADGWDEARAERARQQVLAKIELGIWRPHETAARASAEREPTFAELATDWLLDRERNPAIRARTTEDDRWRLTRYLIPSFGEMLPSQITPLALKQYRRRIHEENEHIRTARGAGTPLRDPRTGQPLRPLSNGSINKTLRTLALILDEAEDAGWITRNVARGRRTREPIERQRRDALEPDELLSLLEAASQLDGERHRPETLAKARQVRSLRDATRMTWAQIGARVGTSETSAIYLYGCNERDGQATGHRRAITATLAFAGLRVSELCALNRQDIDLARGKIRVRDSKTEAGVRVVDIRPRLLEELTSYFQGQLTRAMDAPAFPTSKETRRDRNNISRRIIGPVVKRANAIRAQRDRPPILIVVTPHTFRRTYITFMLAAGFDLPYVQDQVGHTDPITTMGIYARVIRRADRDTLRAELRELFGESEPALGPTPIAIDLASHRRELERSEQRGFER
jgi:integrase